MSQWQPIETAPKDGTRFLAPDMIGAVTICFWSNLDGGCWYDWAVGHLNGRYKPTHWMPLPNPPTPPEVK